MSTAESPALRDVDSGALALPAPPAWGRSSIADVFSSAAAAVGVGNLANVLELPSAQRACVVMIDGLGSQLLKRHAAHAPTLRSLLDNGRGRTLDAAFPSTTAASLASLGTGLAPGQHGLVGYDALDPDRDVIVNQLGRWDKNVDPLAWQPHPTVFERVAEHVTVTTVSQARFKASPMTKAALRGGDFISASTLQARTTYAAERLATGGKHLMYLYADELDKAGHKFGVDSPQWREALEEIDAALGRFLRQVPAGTLVLATGDHGMIDVPESGRFDIGEVRGLMDGVRLTAGEPRMLQLHLSPGASVEDVVQRWREWVGNRAWVLRRDELIDAGWFGPVDDRVRPRIGEVLVAASEPVAFYDVARIGRKALEMIGQHGSWTRAERQVPLLQTVTEPRAAAVKGRRRRG